MPAEPWGTRPKAVKQVPHSVHSQWLNFQDPGKSAGCDRRAPGRVLGAAGGRGILGEPGAPVQPHPGEGGAGGHSSSALGLPLPLGLCCLRPFSHHFLGNLQLISGLLWLWSKMEKAQGLWQQKLGLCEAFFAYKTFTYRIVRFRYMKYLYFLVICSF